MELFCFAYAVSLVCRIFITNDTELRNRSALAVNCCIIIHCLEVSCKEDQITFNFTIYRRIQHCLRRSKSL